MSGSRVVGRPWPKGVSANPGGKPKGLHVRALARAHTEEAVEALVAALAVPSTRVAAAEALLTRGWGKPVQPIEGDIDIRQSWVIRAPAPVDSTREWFARYAPPDAIEQKDD